MASAATAATPAAAPSAVSIAVPPLNTYGSQAQLVAEQKRGQYYNSREMSPFVVEFVGTFIIGLVTGMSSGLIKPFAVAASYVAMVYMGGHISGGHFNPAVTIAETIMTKNGLIRALVYISVQVIGGAMGVFIGSEGLTGTSAVPGPAAGHTVGESFTVELVFAATIVHIYLLSLVAKGSEHNQFFGLAIGLTLLGGIGAAQEISGGIFNPAIALGLIMTNADSVQAKNVWLYLVAPPMGAIIGCVPYMLEEGAVKAKMEKSPVGGVNRAMSKFLHEFWGTGLVVYVAALARGTHHSLALLSVGAMYAAQTYAAGFVSGGHLNPAITIAHWLTYAQKRAVEGTKEVGRSAMEALFYIFVQLVAGVIAGGVASANLVDGNEYFPKLATGVAEWHGFLAETVGVFAITYVYLLVTAESALGGIFFSNEKTGAVTGNSYYGLAVGFAYFALYVAVEQFVGTSLNPAAAVGLAVGNGEPEALDQLYIYLISPVCGGLLAHLAFRITNEADCSKRGAELSFAAVRGPIHEFFGTAALAFSLSLLAIAPSSLVGLAAGAIVLALHYAGEPITGGSYNPAVSFALWLSRRGKLPTKDFFTNFGCQIFGALLGGALATAITGQTPHVAPLLETGEGLWKEYLLQVLFAAAIVYTVLVATTTEATDGKEYFGITYGLATAAAVIVVPSQLPGAFNPAVAGALIAIDGGSHDAQYAWIYIMAPLIGALVALALFRATNESEYILDASARRLTNLRAFVQEFWGTMMLTLVTALALGANLKLAAWAVGGIYVAIVYDGLHVSGSHYNPVVTLAVELHQKLANTTRSPVMETVLKVVAQLLGAIAGALFASYLGGFQFAPTVSGSTNHFQAFVAEFTFAAALVMVFLNVAFTRQQADNSFFGLAAGFLLLCATAGSYAVSQASFNMAMVTGLMIVNGTSAVAELIWLYWLAPLLGGAVGFAIFWFSNRQEYTMDARAVAREARKLATGLTYTPSVAEYEMITRQRQEAERQAAIAAFYEQQMALQKQMAVRDAEAASGVTSTADADAQLEAMRKALADKEAEVMALKAKESNLPPEELGAAEHK